MAEPTLTGLRVIATVAGSGSFRAAAEKLGYTQSAVSRQVAATESAVGVPLFERHARGVSMTAAGEVMVRHASRVIDDLAGARLELAGLRDRLAGLLSVGAYPTAAAVLLPRAIAALKAMHPGVEVRLLEASTPAQLRALRRGRLQVAILATGDGLPDYDLSGLALTELRVNLGVGVAIATSHPFAVREWVRPDELTDQPWIVGATSDSGPEFGAWPGLTEPRIAFRVRDWQTRLGMVAAGLGIALVPGSLSKALPRTTEWVRINDSANLFRRTTYAATPSGATEAATALIGILQQEATNM